MDYPNSFTERANTELEQAIVRFVIGMLVAAYFILGFQAVSNSQGELRAAIYGFIILFVIYSTSLLAANLFWRSTSPLRRIIGIIGDMANISYCLYIGGEQCSFVFCLYLWVLIGNGLRFGERYLWGAMVAALSGFSVVVYKSPFWAEHISMSVGVYFLIVALPLYFAKLLGRLQNVNALLEQRVDERTRELAVEKNNALASSRAKSQFLANMSHELRTPLNAIIGYSEILIEDAEMSSNDVLVEDLSRINKSGQHLLSMIGDILDLSRIEEGKTNLNPTRIKLLFFLDEIFKTVSPMIEKSGNTLSMDRIVESIDLESDETRLRQILLNLLGNATKFTHHGKIHVGISKSKPGWVTLTVQDNGIGIANEHLRKIFEAFAQVDPSYTRHYGGSGLGLAICKRYTKLLGGDISVHSEPNQGSTFTLNLPLKWRGETYQQEEFSGKKAAQA